MPSVEEGVEALDEADVVAGVSLRPGSSVEVETAVDDDVVASVVNRVVSAGGATPAGIAPGQYGGAPGFELG